MLPQKKRKQAIKIEDTRDESHLSNDETEYSSFSNRSWEEVMYILKITGFVQDDIFSDIFLKNWILVK
jgi:hypothetical protein